MHRSRIIRTSTHTPKLNCIEYVTTARDDVRIEVGGGSCAELDQKQISETCPDGQTRRLKVYIIITQCITVLGFSIILRVR